MEGVFVSFRRGRMHQHTSQPIFKVADTAEEAKKAVGKTAAWTSPTGKVLQGKITALHGRTGAVRAVFAEGGLPGQALGKKVKIE